DRRPVEESYRIRRRGVDRIDETDGRRGVTRLGIEAAEEHAPQPIVVKPDDEDFRGFGRITEQTSEVAHRGVTDAGERRLYLLAFLGRAVCRPQSNQRRQSLEKRQLDEQGLR